MTKKYFLLICLFLIAVVFALSGNITPSTTNAAYKSEIDASSTGTVAKWDISEIGKNGAGIELTSTVQHVNSGDRGNWFFEITNASDVTAEIDKTSLLDFRVESSVFSLDAYSDSSISHTWDFLYDGENTKDNPIEFLIEIYQGTSDEIISGYMLKQNPGTTITKEAYLKLTVEEQKKYLEVLDSSKLINVIFTSSESTKTSIELKHVKDETGTKDLLTQSFPIVDQTVNSEKYLFKLNEGVTTKTIRVYWYIGQGSTDSGSDISDKYYVYDLLDNNVLDSTPTEYDLFGYLRYLSSIKGEPVFEMVNTSGIAVNVAASKLTSEQRKELEDNRVNEYHNLTEYERFNSEYNNYLLSQGYLTSGLTCSFNLKINVVQVD